MAFLSMGRTIQLVEGDTLADRLEQGPLKAAEAGPVALSILAALQALHDQDLVHRDVKPSNVFLTNHGVKLLDFGLARRVDPSNARTTLSGTRPGMLVGTPQYMAPDQVRGEPVDGRTDLFAVGVLLFEMLAGRHPFAGETAVAVMHAILHEQPPALVGSAGIAALDRVIRRAMEKNSEQRQASAAAMAEELRVALLLGDSGEVLRAQVLTRLAVLPFRLLRPDPEVGFLTFGLADAMTASLPGIESLVVLSSRVTARFGDDVFDLEAIARELEVDVILTGTLLRSGDQVRLATERMDVADGRILWSQTSEVALTELFQHQDKLIRRILDGLPVTEGEQTEARRLDPSVSTGVSHTYVIQGEYDRVVGADDCTDDFVSWTAALSMLGKRDETLAAMNSHERQYFSHQVLQSYFKAFRAVLEGRRDDAVRAMDDFLGGPGWKERRFYDGEGLFYAAKMMASLGEREAALEILQHSFTSGFFCFPAFARDPSLDVLRGLPEFVALVRQVQARHRAAAQRFADLGGERLLGVSVSF